jgi:DNA invertase Pin-like site-specific DNA recombinase
MIGIYCRISKRKEEGRDVSIAVQKEAGIKFATQQRTPYKLFVDEGISGAKGEIADRPMFADLFKAIEDKKISMVYCYDQSRIERNSNIWSLFVGVMLKNDCKYYPEGKFFDLDDPTNRFFSGILSLSN